jgi:hypothetical protein
MTRRRKHPVGTFLRIPLPDGSFGYGRLLEWGLVACYDHRSAQPDAGPEAIRWKRVLFTVCVSAPGLGTWESIGCEPLAGEVAKPVVQFRQDLFDFRQCTIFDSAGMEKNVGPEACVGLERSAVWEGHHVAERLLDGFMSCPNKTEDHLRVRLDDRNVAGVIEQACREWAEPRAVEAGGLRVRCTMEPARGLPAIEPPPPPFLVELWAKVNTARLFEDADYGQWGLELLSPHESAEASGAFRRARVRDRKKGDLVVGRFLGDSDLLVVRADSKAADFGSVLVALPLDRRADWYHPAASLETFVRSFIAAKGAKFWIQRKNGDHRTGDG